MKIIANRRGKRSISFPPRRISPRDCSLLAHGARHHHRRPGTLRAGVPARRAGNPRHHAPATRCVRARGRAHASEQPEPDRRSASALPRETTPRRDDPRRLLQGESRGQGRDGIRAVRRARPPRASPRSRQACRPCTTIGSAPARPPWCSTWSPRSPPPVASVNCRSWRSSAWSCNRGSPWAASPCTSWCKAGKCSRSRTRSRRRTRVGAGGARRFLEHPLRAAVARRTAERASQGDPADLSGIHPAVRFDSASSPRTSCRYPGDERSGRVVAPRSRPTQEVSPMECLIARRHGLAAMLVLGSLIALAPLAGAEKRDPIPSFPSRACSSTR